MFIFWLWAYLIKVCSSFDYEPTWLRFVHLLIMSPTWLWFVHLLIMSPTWLRFVPTSCVLSSISTFSVFTQQDERGIENHAAEILCIISIPYFFEKRRCNTLLYKKKTRRWFVLIKWSHTYLDEASIVQK
jgi:hypothetical protein